MLTTSLNATTFLQLKPLIIAKYNLSKLTTFHGPKQYKVPKYNPSLTYTKMVHNLPRSCLLSGSEIRDL